MTNMTAGPYLSFLAIHLFFLSLFTASASTASGRNTTTAGTFRSSLFHSLFYKELPPLTNEQLLHKIELEVERKKKEIQRAVDHLRLEIEQNAEASMRKIERDANTHTNRIKQHVQRTAFRQRQGWERLRHSVRDHLGMFVGGIVTFAGGGKGDNHSRLARSAAAMQVAQLTWALTDRFNVTRGKHDPWLKDSVAISIGCTSLASYSPCLYRLLLPPVFLVCEMSHATNLVADKYEVEVGGLTRAIAVAAVSTVGIVVLGSLSVPLPIASACVSGATLVYDSITAEVAGNWFYMIERIGPRRLRLQKHLYELVRRTVREAVEEVHVRLEDTAGKKGSAGRAIYRLKRAWRQSVRIHLIWSFAAMGVVLQMGWISQLRKLLSKVFFKLSGVTALTSSGNRRFLGKRGTGKSPDMGGDAEGQSMALRPSQR